MRVEILVVEGAAVPVGLPLRVGRGGEGGQRRGGRGGGVAGVVIHLGILPLKYASHCLAVVVDVHSARTQRKKV